MSTAIYRLLMQCIVVLSDSKEVAYAHHTDTSNVDVGENRANPQ